MHPSRQILDALARALRLAPAERAHLYELAHGQQATHSPGTVETLAPAVAALVDRLDPRPAYVTGRRFDVLAANRAARALWTDWSALPPQKRNMLWWMFTDPAARTTLIQWEAEASPPRIGILTNRSSSPSSSDYRPPAPKPEPGGRATTWSR